MTEIKLSDEPLDGLADRLAPRVADRILQDWCALTGCLPTVAVAGIIIMTVYGVIKWIT